MFQWICSKPWIESPHLHFEPCYGQLSLQPCLTECLYFQSTVLRNVSFIIIAHYTAPTMKGLKESEVYDTEYETKATPTACFFFCFSSNPSSFPDISVPVRCSQSNKYLWCVVIQNSEWNRSVQAQQQPGEMHATGGVTACQSVKPKSLSIQAYKRG